MKCYIVIKPCGCVAGAIVDCGLDYVEETVAEWKSDGYKVENVSVEEAKARLKLCSHNEEGAKQ